MVLAGVDIANLLDVNVDTEANDTAVLTSGYLNAGTITVDGQGTNDTFNFNGSFVAPLGTTQFLWRLGDDDPGAANGGAGNANTLAYIGNVDPARTAIGPTYTNLTPSSASTLALLFSGAGCYGDVPSVNVTNNFGIELWVKPSNTAGIKTLVYNGNSTANGWGLKQVNAGYTAEFGGVAAFGVITAATAGKWDHFAMVRNNGTIYWYLNGAQVGFTPATPNAPAGEFMIGGDSILGDEMFAGAIDHVRFFTFTAGAFNPATYLTLNTTPALTSTPPRQPPCPKALP